VRRREFIGFISSAATLSFAAEAQQKRPVIGFFGVHSPGTLAPGLLPAFWRGLNEVGYHEDRNVVVDYVWAEGRYERLPGLAAELVRRRVDVIVAAGGSIAAQTAKNATSTIPIIILAGDDPVRLGLVNSINRPGGNLTGVAQLVVASEAKRLELLRELVRTVDVVAFLSNPARSNSERQVAEMQKAAAALGLKLLIIEADEDDDLAPAFARARAEAGALVVGADPYFFVRRDRLVALAADHTLPTMYFFREFVLAGGLVSYGSNLASAFHQVGVYTGKVLNGSPPAELPLVQQSDKLELILNVRTARALGLTIPPTLLARADEVIE
jgi:putative ABC transport system substrate-binding protein